MQPVSNDNIDNELSNGQDTVAASVLDVIDETMARTSEQEAAIYKVIRRNGKVTPFDRSKLKLHLQKHFLV